MLDQGSNGGGRGPPGHEPSSSAGAYGNPVPWRGLLIVVADTRIPLFSRRSRRAE